MRGRFVWLGAGVVLLALGGLATVATQDTWLDSYGVVAYFLAPLMFLPLSAGSIAAPRANRFVESVFTAPVERRDWLAAKVIVLLSVAAAYYAALIPMMLVYAAHIGMPPLLARLVLWTPGILLASIATGTLIGVLFIGRSVAPPVATSVGAMLFCAVCVPLQELLVARGYGATVTGHLTLASPVVLLKNGLGFALAVGTVPASTLQTWCCFALVIVGSFALAGWIFLRTQGVESWEASRFQARAIAVGLTVLALIPAVCADANYDAPAPAVNAAPGIRGLFSRGGGVLALVRPGAGVPSRCCATLLNRGQWPSLPVGEETRQDLLLLLPVDSGRAVQDLHIQVAGQYGLNVLADPVSLEPVGSHLEKWSYSDESGPVTSDGKHVQSGWIVRVPVTLTPTAPWDIGGVRYPLDLTATYRLEGDLQSRDLTEHAAVEAHVPGALIQMAFAGAVLPAGCFFLALIRRRRTR
jgi:ABC-type transport system involved in multi-copper enzyme maturation permease subunit